MNARIVARGLTVSDSNPFPVQLVVPSTASAATFVRGSKIPAATGTPEALAAGGTLVQSVVIYAQRGARTGNTGSVFIDSASANDAQQIELMAGQSWQLTAPPGKTIDLSLLYVDAVTLGDGVFFFGVL
jgi:hypothetical protein